MLISRCYLGPRKPEILLFTGISVWSIKQIQYWQLVSDSYMGFGESAAVVFQQLVICRTTIGKVH